MDTVLPQSSEAEKANGNLDVSKDEEFQRSLVREVARTAKEKKSLDLLWSKLQEETGCDCKRLWSQMVYSATNKMMCMLAANDILDNIENTKRLSSIDWLLFDLILVHEKITVTKCDVLPQCLIELYNLVKKHNLENLNGNELAHEWIQLTLEYNNGGRQCSPMLLQLRWYQLKEMSRSEVFNRDATRDQGTIKVLHDIAIKHQKIVTQPFPRWDTLIKEKRVILPEQFVRILNRNGKWTDGEANEGWYLQVNTEAYDNLMKSYNVICKNQEISFVDVNKPKTDVTSDDEIKDICENAKDIINSNTTKPNHEVDSLKKVIAKDESKYRVDVTENKVRARSKNKIDIEISKVLHNKVKVISESSEPNLDNIKHNNELAFKEGKDKQKNKLIDTDDTLADVSKSKRRKDIDNSVRIQYNDSTEIKQENDIDPKLLSSAVVCTRKLDSMTVFKNIAYDSVRDKNVIECATLESIPKFK